MDIHPIFIVWFFLFIIICIWAVFASLDERRQIKARIRALQIADVDSMTGLEFEHYVCCLLQHKGYSAEVTKASGDYGADILATRHNEKIAIQTKRYTKKVSNKAVNEAYAAMAHYKCSQCAVVTNNYFTSAAINLAKSTGCLLVDRDELANWIHDFQGNAALYVDPTVPVYNVTEHEQVSCADLISENAASTSRPNNDAVQEQYDVDPAIIARLWRAAEIDFPGDYETQVYELEEQLEAYKSIQFFQAPDLPEDVLSAIIKSATTDYEDDFSTAKYVIDQQVDAYRKMQTFCV